MEKHRVTAERYSGPAFGGLLGSHKLRGHPELGHDLVHSAGQGRAVVDRAGGGDQFPARLVGQLPPQHLRLAGQPHVERIRVGPPEDPGAAMRAAAPVPGLERLHEHDRAPLAGQGPGCGRPGQPGANDDRVRPLGTHGPTVTRAVAAARKDSGRAARRPGPSASTNSRSSAPSAPNAASTQRGLIQRQPDAADRRVHLLSLTPAGDRLRRSVEAAIRDSERDVLAGLPPADREAFLRPLKALHERYRTP